MADEITARIYDDRTREWVPLEVIMQERAEAKAQRQYLMTRVYVCDRDGEQEPREVAGLEISADDWELVIAALEGDTIPGSAGARWKLASAIRMEVYNKLPEGVE